MLNSPTVQTSLATVGSNLKSNGLINRSNSTGFSNELLISHDILGSSLPNDFLCTSNK
jgi:hypothetical protein